MRTIDNFLDDTNLSGQSAVNRQIRVLIKLKDGVGVIPYHPGVPNSFQVGTVSGAEGREILGYCQDYKGHKSDPVFYVKFGRDFGNVRIDQINSIMLINKGGTMYAQPPSETAPPTC